MKGLSQEMDGDKDAQMSETFRTAASLAFVGGFLESYTFMLHGHVFANVQSGNIALCGMSAADGDWPGVLKYLSPVIAFVLGVATAEWVREHWNVSKINWRRSVVAVEALLLCGCLLLEGSSRDMSANLIVSVVCALQMQTFQKVRGMSYASTMCTGNLRAATVAWLAYRKSGTVDVRRRGLRYLGIIFLFLAGTATAIPLIKMAGVNAIALPIAVLVATSVLMSCWRSSL